MEIETDFDYIKSIQHDSCGELIATNAQELVDMCHGLANQCGWWSDSNVDLELMSKEQLLDALKLQINANKIPRLLMLCVSELSEAMEGHRKNLNDDHLPHRKMLEVELADAVIRIFDMAGGLKLDIAGAIAEKLKYNSTRADHKLENRAEEGGKDY